MARKDKAERAAYMRKYRARKAGEVVVERHNDVLDVSAGLTGVKTYEVVHRPPFLAAPVDECPLCGHDRQEADHLGGRPCKFKTSPRRSCGCSFEGF